MDNPKILWKNKQRQLRIQRREDREEEYELIRNKTVEKQKNESQKDTSKVSGYEIFSLFLAFAISIFLYDTFFTYIQHILLTNIDNWFTTIVIKTGIFLIYIIPFFIAAMTIKSRFLFLRILGLFFAGLGFGIVIRYAISFVAVLNPYKMY